MHKTIKVRSHKFSALKSVVWRVLGIIIKALITYIFTRSCFVTTAVTFVHHTVFLVIFYLHERVWYKFPNITGRKRFIFKAFIYEIILGMGLGGLIIYLFTGNWLHATYQTIIYTIIKLVLYYFYDKLWT